MVSGQTNLQTKWEKEEEENLFGPENSSLA